MSRGRAIAVATAIAAAGCEQPDRASAEPVLRVSVEQASAWLRNFNPLLASGIARWPSRAGIYEPLAIYNPVTGAWLPWLATSWQWSDDLRALELTLRPGVRWSDGRPFTARDVEATFALLRRQPALDLEGVWQFLDGVRAVDAHTVRFSLSRPYVPGFASIAHQPIVPAHIWAELDDPVSFTNPEPVATGPYTEVRVFRNQVYELGRNPHYWGGQPAVPALRMSAYPGNDQVHLALIDGTLDWAAVFVPAVERTYVARDPAHNHHWSPTIGPTILLYPNTARPPLDDVRVRRALSMAIDRERIAAIAMEGTTRPADATGLSDGFARWKDPEVAGDTWVHTDPEAAEALLDAAGYPRGAEGLRRELALDIQVVSGWSDWVRAAQLIADDLRAIGVDAHVRVSEFGAWMQNVQRGAFSLAIAWSLDGPTPHRTYRWLMASDTVRPLGELAPGNWHRFGDPRADALLADLEAATEPDRQRALVAGLQRRFSALVPAVPLFSSPLWGTYSTRRFTGFPHAADPYARLSPLSEPDVLLVLTRLAPRED